MYSNLKVEQAVKACGLEDKVKELEALRKLLDKLERRSVDTKLKIAKLMNEIFDKFMMENKDEVKNI